MIVHMGRVYSARSQTGSRREATTVWRRTVGYIVTLALSILTAPLAANAQKSGKIPLVGVLQSGPAPDPSDPRDSFNAFRQGLRALSYVEGQNIAIAHRFAEGQFERLPELAAELVHLKVDVIATSGPAAVRVAQHATSAIPGLTNSLAAQQLATGAAHAQPRGSGFTPTRRGGGGLVRLLYWSAPTFLNPHLALGPSDFEASEIFYEPLADIAADGTIVPVLATEVPSVDNGGVARAVSWNGQ